MVKLTIINSTLGAGKTEVSSRLSAMLPNSIIVRGDDISSSLNEFSVYDEKKIFECLELISNEVNHLSNDYSNIILDYVFETSEQMNYLLARVNEGIDKYIFYIKVSEKEVCRRIRMRNREQAEWELTRTVEILSKQLNAQNIGKLGTEIESDGVLVDDVALQILNYLNESAHNYDFKELSEVDLHYIEKWITEPHVKLFWDDGKTWNELYEKYVLRISSNVIKQFIIYFNKTAIGYIQFYWASKVGDGWWKDFDDKVIGIDQYIGETSYLGKGHGARSIREFINYLKCRYDISKIICDPSPHNEVAIRCYEKVGFKSTGEVETPDGKALLMEYKL
ncbi:MAG: GNAT family N-acetyltransferase [Bacteriovoracaceae bacterium]